MRSSSHKVRQWDPFGNRKSSGWGAGASVQQEGWSQVVKWSWGCLSPSGSPQMTETKGETPGHLQLAQRCARMHGFLEKGGDPGLATLRAHYLTCQLRMAITFLKGQEWGLNEKCLWNAQHSVQEYSKYSESIICYYSKGCLIIFSSGFQNLFLLILTVKHFFPQRNLIW